MNWSKGFAGGRADLEKMIAESDIPDSAKGVLQAHVPKEEDGHIWRLSANGHDDRTEHGANVLISMTIKKGEKAPEDKAA